MKKRIKRGERIMDRIAYIRVKKEKKKPTKITSKEKPQKKSRCGKTFLIRKIQLKLYIFLNGNTN